MTAFLFIASTGGTLGRRVDFSNIGSLFAEDDDPAPRRQNPPRTRLLLFLAVLAGMLADAILVARPEAVSRCLSVAALTPNPHPDTMF